MRSIRTIDFTKMSGTGNDFIVIDAFHRTLNVDWSEFARRYCPRRTGVGVDGVLVLSPSSSADFDYRIFNADGSEAEMCGNGARCAAAFAVRHGLAGNDMRFHTLAGIVEAKVNPEDVSIKVTQPKELKTGIGIEVDARNEVVHFVNTGVPHTILFTKNLDAAPVDALGRKIRNHPHFSPAGTNVDFVEVSGSEKIRVRTYERGVEAETLACGTGAIASAILSHATGNVPHSSVLVSMPGGNLKIDFTNSNGEYHDIWLTGEVSFIFTGTHVF
jgi:diaminopimelate epimerase